MHTRCFSTPHTATRAGRYTAHSPRRGVSGERRREESREEKRKFERRRETRRDHQIRLQIEDTSASDRTRQEHETRLERRETR